MDELNYFTKQNSEPKQHDENLSDQPSHYQALERWMSSNDKDEVDHAAILSSN